MPCVRLSPLYVNHHVLRLAAGLEPDGPVRNAGGHDEVGALTPFQAVAFVVQAQPFTPGTWQICWPDTGFPQQTQWPARRKSVPTYIFSFRNCRKITDATCLGESPEIQRKRL